MEQRDTSNEDSDEVQDLLVAFSVAFGNILAVKLGLAWGIAQFADGDEDFTICDEDAKIYLYPISLVQKRFDRGETDYFVPLQKALKKNVRDLRRRERPAWKLW